MNQELEKLLDSLRGAVKEMNFANAEREQSWFKSAYNVAIDALNQIDKLQERRA